MICAPTNMGIQISLPDLPLIYLGYIFRSGFLDYMLILLYFRSHRNGRPSMPAPLRASPKPPRPAFPGSPAWSPAPSPLLCRMSQHLSTAGSHLAPWLFSLHFLLRVCVEGGRGSSPGLWLYAPSPCDDTQTDFSGPLTPVSICLPALSMGTYDEYLALNVSKEIFFFFFGLLPYTSFSSDFTLSIYCTADHLAL